METVDTASETHFENANVIKARLQGAQNRLLYAGYALALVVSISVWFIAFRAPLWLDETGSYWMICRGFAAIWPERLITLCFPGYFYTLWAFTKLLGTSEIALRIPSILAMLGAAYLLYLAARELFDRDLALIAVVVFCLDPIVVFASIDVRPYAFAVLATNAAILVLLRLRHNSSNWMAALFGFLAAFIVYFHSLFGAILPALLLCFFVVKIRDPKALWRQFGVAFAAFVLGFLPVIPGLRYLFHTSGTHVYEKAPTLLNLFFTLAPGWLSVIFVVAGFVAFVVAAATPRKQNPPKHFDGWRVLLCASLALIPLLILYGVSVGTSIHLFAGRHRLVAIPGIALCWALLVSLFPSRTVRLLFCIALVAATALPAFKSPKSRDHLFTWKYALQAAQKNASVDNAPVVICSDFPEADYAAMPLDSPKTSYLFTQLSYYKLTVPVIPMPRALNNEAIRVGSQFLEEAAQKHERFFALAFKPSYPTLDWLTQSASGNFNVHKLGTFDDIEVLEFVPKAAARVSGGSLRPTSKSRSLAQSLSWRHHRHNEINHLVAATTMHTTTNKRSAISNLIPVLFPLSGIAQYHSAAAQGL